MKMLYDASRWGRSNIKIVAAIIYHPIGNFWRPQSVFTVDEERQYPPHHARTTIYYFDYCRRDDIVYYHCSGGGGTFYLDKLCKPKQKPRCCVWWDDTLVSPTNSLIHKRYLVKRTVEKWGYDIVSAPLTLDFTDGEQNPFIAGQENTVEYCSRCQDWLPMDTDNPCDHIWWCEKCQTTSTPQERCKHRRPL